MKYMDLILMEEGTLTANEYDTIIKSSYFRIVVTKFFKNKDRHIRYFIITDTDNVSEVLNTIDKIFGMRELCTQIESFEIVLRINDNKNCLIKSEVYYGNDSEKAKKLFLKLRFDD